MAESHRGGALGRRVNHDPRSLAYKVVPRGDVRSANWTRNIPILDQGQLGSCTGNATVGVLGSDPFTATLPADLTLDEDLAVALYSAATKLDPFEGDYPPEDTGSDGNSVAKAARNAGYISGWEHITNLAAAHTAIQSGPFIFGLNWYSSMDEPDVDGVVDVSGDIRGGHEIEVVGYSVETGLWKIANSWTDDWGKDGYFYLSDANFARLLSEDGDATALVPLNLPAPTPTPTPEPDNPGPSISDFPTEDVQRWLDGKHYTRRERKAAQALQEWLNG